MPKISVIVPVYNVEKYLRQALDSVINQTLKDIEIICVDDCSTDGSSDILKEYAQKDNRIKLLRHKENQGLGTARNTGLESATGEYIMFFDSDDWYELNAFELCYEQISKNGNDFVIFGYNRYIESTGEVQYNNRDSIRPFDKYLSATNIKLEDVDTNFIASCFVWPLIYRRDFIEVNKLRFPKYRMFEDQTFYIKAMLCAETISVIDKALYYYRVRNTSLTFVYKNQYNDILNVKKEILQILAQFPEARNLKRAIYAHTIRSTLYWFDFYQRKFKKNRKLLYTNVRKILFLLDCKYVENNVKHLLSGGAYKQYRKIIKSSWLVYSSKQLLKKIFSLTNCDNHKVITILGIKYKFRKDIRLINFRFFSYLTAWIFPLEEDRIKYRELCSAVEERKCIIKAHKNYPKIIKRIKQKNGPVRVLFLVNEIAKWKTQSLYDLLSQDKNFEPLIALTIADIQWDYTKEERKNIINKNRQYFASKNMNCVVAYDSESGKPLDLKLFKPDIIFYQQPWGVSAIQHPKRTAKYALPYYVPYHVDNYSAIPFTYNKDFHKYLYRHYVLNKEWESEYKKLSGRNNFKGLGHTELDYFYLNKEVKSDKNYVIYAPHYSFSHKLNPNPVNYGTFLKDRYEILEFAKKHPEINWVFKPHPQLIYSLLRMGETKEQVNSYWDEWRKIGIVCENPDYMGLFMDSRVLITDSASFLTEYFCTGKPIIHLISSTCKIEPNQIAEKIFNTFYKVNNLDEMYDAFEKVIIQEKDYKKDLRLKVLKESGLLNNYAAQNIMSDIIDVVGKDKIMEAGMDNKKRIFTFWEPKGKIPPYLKLCIATWKKYMPDYEIVILDYSDIEKWLGKSFFDKILYSDFGLAQQADSIRCALLEKYGGIWFDTDTVITSKNIENLINIKSQCVMLGWHIGFIIAQKHAKILKKWLWGIKRNLLVYKLCKKYPKFKKIVKHINNDFAENMMRWDFLGNRICDPYFKNYKKELFWSIDRIEINALPEVKEYSGDPMKVYRRFYFEENSCDKALKDTRGVIYLHNSWTPKKYKDMTIKEFLAEENTLSRLFLNLLSEEEIEAAINS